MAGVIDVAYPIREGWSDWDDEELRYSLRSVNDNVYRRIGGVWVFGHRPPFLGDVRHVPVQTVPEKSFDLMRKYRAMVDSDLSDPFLLLDDDHIFLEPHCEFPPYTQGTLVPLWERQWVQQQKRYGAYIHNCIVLLRRHGLPERNYQLHCPILVHKAKLDEVLRMAEGVGTVMGSLYGNLVGGPSIERAIDFRVYSLAAYLALRGGPFISVEERLVFAEDLGSVGLAVDMRRVLANRFPHPSPWEAR